MVHHPLEQADLAAVARHPLDLETLELLEPVVKDTLDLQVAAPVLLQVAAAVLVEQVAQTDRVMVVMVLRLLLPVLL